MIKCSVFDKPEGDMPQYEWISIIILFATKHEEKMYNNELISYVVLEYACKYTAFIQCV